MRFQESAKPLIIGKAFGFLSSYALFTLILFVVLGFLDKLPGQEGLQDLAAITATIILLGAVIKGWLR